MSVLQADMFDEDVVRQSWTDWLARWPIVSCLIITALFMLATNDPEATTRWQEVSREKQAQLSLVVASGRPVRQLSLLALGLWGLASLRWTPRKYRSIPTILFPMLILVGWAFVSILWSTDRSFTVKRLFVFACVATAVWGFVRRMRPGDLALLALIGCTIQTVFNVGADLMWHTGEYGKSGYRLSGLQHPNHAGLTAVFMGFACLYFFDRTRLKRFALLGVAALAVLMMSKSRSSLFAGIAGVGLYALLRWPWRNVLAGALAVGIFGSAFAALGASGALPENLSGLIQMGRDDTSSPALTGRPMLWNAALEIFGNDSVRYLTGFGYDSFWTPEHALFVSNRVQFPISEGHDAYFDLLLALGVVGATCYVIILFSSLVRWSQLARRHECAAYAFCAAVLMFAVVHGITESTLIAATFPTFFSFASMTFLAIRAPRPYPAEQSLPMLEGGEW